MAVSADLRTLARLQARCIALVSARHMLLHKSRFWQNAAWDERTSEHAAQIWVLRETVTVCAGVLPIELSLEALRD